MIISFPFLRNSHNKMDNTLIVYASEHGTVEKCARELFELLDGKVDMCDLNQRSTFPDLSIYDAVIIGGSIHSGAIQQSISDFCNTNIEFLRETTLGLFITCMYSGEKADEQLKTAFPAELSEKAVARDYFGGEIDKSKLSFWERIVTTQMMEKENLILHLSIDKIHRFAEKLKNNEKIEE